MGRVAVAFVCFLTTGVVCPGEACAQDDSSFQLPGNPVVKKVEIDRAGGVHLTKTLSIVFGGIKEGSSMAAGPALSHEFANGSFVQLKGVYSVRNFKLLQARFDSGPVFHGRGMVSTRVRWQDAPELSLYALGPDSPQARAEYGEQKTEWSGFMRYGLVPHVTVTAGAGMERYAVNAGFLNLQEDEHLDVVPNEPGLSSRPWFVHSFGSIAFDTRLSPDYSRTGTALLGGIHHYHDLHDGRGSFRGYEAGIAHLFPTVATKETGPAAWKGALELAARAWLTDSGDGSTVPFYLMPTLGGGDFLRGYPSYRFRDRNALLLSAEYRWAVHPMFDVAAIYETGSVAPSVRRLGARFAQSAGGGLRLHSKTAGLMRIDLTRGGEGLQFSIGFNVAGG